MEGAQSEVNHSLAGETRMRAIF